jgi:hypothetical protein
MALSDRDRRALIILGAVVGVALVGFLLMNVLGGGGGEEASPSPVITTAPTASPTPSVTPTPRETLPPVVLAGARDPFSIPPALNVSPSGGVSPSTTVPPTGTTTPPTTVPPTTVPPTTVPPTTPPPTTPPPTTPPPTSPPPAPNTTTIGGHTVTLQDVNAKADRVKVKVDKQVWIVEEGGRFDDNFKLVAIKGDCARFLFGDEAFELCLTGSE